MLQIEAGVGDHKLEIFSWKFSALVLLYMLPYPSIWRSMLNTSWRDKFRMSTNPPKWLVSNLSHYLSKIFHKHSSYRPPGTSSWFFLYLGEYLEFTACHISLENKHLRLSNYIKLTMLGIHLISQVATASKLTYDTEIFRLLVLELYFPQFTTNK